MTSQYLLIPYLLLNSGVPFCLEHSFTDNSFWKKMSMIGLWTSYGTKAEEVCSRQFFQIRLANQKRQVPKNSGTSFLIVLQKGVKKNDTFVLWLLACFCWSQCFIKVKSEPQRLILNWSFELMFGRLCQQCWCITTISFIFVINKKETFVSW